MTIDLHQLFETNQLEEKKFASALLKALKTNALDGFDYLKFKQSVANLKEMNMDDEQAIKSAFMTATTIGLTKPKLLSTAKHYENILTKERREFAEALANQVATKVENKEEKHRAIDDAIKSNRQKIEDLKQQIKTLVDKKENLDLQIAKDKEKIEYTKNTFNQSFDHVFDSLQKDIEMVKQYL